MLVRWLWTSLPSPTTSRTREYWSHNTFLRTEAWERGLLQKKSHLSVIAERNKLEFFWFTSTLVITWTSSRISHFLNDPKLKGLDNLQVLLAFCWCQDSLGMQSLVASQCWLILYLEQLFPFTSSVLSSQEPALSKLWKLHRKVGFWKFLYVEHLPRQGPSLICVKTDLHSAFKLAKLQETKLTR